MCTLSTFILCHVTHIVTFKVTSYHLTPYNSAWVHIWYTHTSCHVVTMFTFAHVVSSICKFAYIITVPHQTNIYFLMSPCNFVLTCTCSYAKQCHIVSTLTYKVVGHCDIHVYFWNRTTFYYILFMAKFKTWLAMFG